VKRFWVLFFLLVPIFGTGLFVVAPHYHWWFPYGNESASPIGQQIDGLFNLTLAITGLTFVATQLVLVWVLWKCAKATDTEGKATFVHGSHNLEAIWTIIPSGILLFIALVQLPVVANIRVKSRFPEGANLAPIAEVTARQFEWRIRYPSKESSASFKTEADVVDWLKNPRPDDLYAVNELHVPSGRPVQIRLRSGDTQHAFFVPELRVKQDAVPGLIIPVWFEIIDNKPYQTKFKGVSYEFLCAELCGWGHYKMKALLISQPEEEFEAFLDRLKEEQFFDGFAKHRTETK